MRDVHYLLVVTNGPLIMARVPYPMPRWRSVVKGVTAVMHSLGLKGKDVSSIEGAVPWPDLQWTVEDHTFAVRLDRAFAGDVTVLPNFKLFTWTRGRFSSVRGKKRRR